MKYMGSKSKVAKYIVPILQQDLYINEKTIYLEPFCGGCNIIDKIVCNTKIASDRNPFLIALLKHVKDGLDLYKEVPKDLYDSARTCFNTKTVTDNFEDWQIGCISFLASFNGRGFDGGYAKAGYEGTRLRDYYREAKANLINQAENFYDIDFYSKDYYDWTDFIKEHSNEILVYCDPPYNNTKPYRDYYTGKTKFDTEKFWEVMREWSSISTVYISEEEAPEDFECVWEKPIIRCINASDKSKSTEKLFKMKGKENV